MALFSKMDRPIFLKEESDATRYIEKLEALKLKVNNEVKDKIEKEVKLVSIGKFGEDNIAFELKNSGIPMYIIRDLHIEVDDLSAQIDFVVVTKKFNLIIECKNLIGDIEIDNGGNFIRTYDYNHKKFKEGIYSPVTQNVRHLEVLKLLKKDKQKNIIMKLAVDKFFDGMNKSVVVLANPKTILNAKYAKKELKDQVIRGDQLTKYIKDMLKNSKEIPLSDNDMEAAANRLLAYHTPNKADYTKKYQSFVEDVKIQDDKVEIVKETTVDMTDDLVKNLKAFRLKRSREENIKPYFIFNDKQMEEIIEKMPKSHDTLMKVSGFGPVKSEKYGSEIIEILSKY